MDQNGKLPNLVADGIQIVMTDHGVKLLIQSADNVKPKAQGVQLELVIAAILNLSHAHLKLFTILAHRQLREWEKENGDIILPKKLIEVQKVDLAKEW